MAAFGVLYSPKGHVTDVEGPLLNVAVVIPLHLLLVMGIYHLRADAKFFEEVDLGLSLVLVAVWVEACNAGCLE